MTEDETEERTKIDKNDSKNAVVIPTFDIHSKNIENGNGSQPTPTSFDVTQITLTSLKHY